MASNEGSGNFHTVEESFDASANRRYGNWRFGGGAFSDDLSPYVDTYALVYMCTQGIVLKYLHDLPVVLRNGFMAHSTSTASKDTKTLFAPLSDSGNK